jgi:polyisoprenoid-binding protein YceI
VTTDQSTVRAITSSRPTRILVIAAFVIAAAVVAGGVFYLFGRSTPAAVSLTESGSSGAAAVAATDDTRPTGTPAGTSDLDGTWTVDASIGSFADYTSSFVGYRVQEELANIGAATAVGRTPDVTGTLVLDGTTIASVEVEADLTTLQSDNDMRDGQLARQGLETATYPTATFVQTDPIELETLPAEGETISVIATGELTLHGVTNTVEIPLEAQLNDGVVTVVGSLDIAFADYGMSAPQSMMVLSIDDQGAMEFRLQLTKA